MIILHQYITNPESSALENAITNSQIAAAATTTTNSWEEILIPLLSLSLSIKDVHFGVSISSLSFFPAIFSVDDSPAEKKLHQPHQPL